MKTLGFLARRSAGFTGMLSAAAWLATTPIQARNNPADTTPSGTPSEAGTASYYADRYNGRPTASGEIFDMHQFTAAHPRLKFGTLVRVTNTENHRTVLVRINDRGPFVAGRVIDLSLAAAEELQMVRRGLAAVTLEVLPP